MAPLRTLLVLFGVVSITQADELTTLDGKKSVGEIVSIDAKELVFKSKAGNATYDLTKLSAIDITAPKDPTPGTKWVEVELIDGSQFRCSDFKIKGKTAILTLLGTNRNVEIPASTLLYMIRDLSDPKLNQAFRGILSKRGKRDIWIVPKGESLDEVKGTFGDGDDKGESIKFEIETNGEKIDIQMSRVYGMVFNQTPGEVAQTVCKVTDAGKNTLYAKSLSLTEKKSVVIETVTGVRVEYPNIAAIGKLDFSAGAVMFLSNVDPSKLEQTSTEGVPEPYRRDRNLDNDDIKIAGIKYGKGLAIHSRSVLTYDLNGKYKLFQTTVGVDDCVEGESKVTLTIEADFKPIFKEVVKKGDKAKVLNLGILNVKQLRITVESDFLDLGNQVDLAEAKVLK